METFFKVVGIIVIIILALRILGRYVFPLLLKWLLNRFAKKMQQNFEQQFGQHAPQNEGFQQTNNGQSASSSSKKGNRNKQAGEYVDFEEIRD